jgi:hypothetical protein
MIHVCTILLLLSTTQDSVNSVVQIEQGYSRQVLISTILGFGCTVGTGIFHLKGNDAYAEYEAAENMNSAIEAWDKVQLYDNVRNVFAVGALVFVARAIYYQVKRARVRRSVSISPVLDFQYANTPKIIVGLRKHL